jgi:hypothetical protein
VCRFSGFLRGACYKLALQAGLDYALNFNEKGPYATFPIQSTYPSNRSQNGSYSQILMCCHRDERLRPFLLSPLLFLVVSCTPECPNAVRLIISCLSPSEMFGCAPSVFSSKLFDAQHKPHTPPSKNSGAVFVLVVTALAHHYTKSLAKATGMTSLIGSRALSLSRCLLPFFHTFALRACPTRANVVSFSGSRTAPQVNRAVLNTFYCSALLVSVNEALKEERSVYGK